MFYNLKTLVGGGGGAYFSSFLLTICLCFWQFLAFMLIQKYQSGRESDTGVNHP